MISVVIIDDETKARTNLKELLHSVCSSVEIIGEADGVASGLQLLSRVQPDAVLLDIQMKDGTGFDLLDRLPSLDYHIIFITAHEEFALKAFRYYALTYLVKPIDPDDLLSVCRKIKKEKENKLSGQHLRHLLESVQNRKIENVALSTNEGMIYLKLKEIIRLESDGNYTFFYTSGQEKFVVSRTIKEFEELLPEDIFFRTHQSHIVNLQEVRKVLKEDGGYALMGDGTKVPISRRKKDDFLMRLGGMSI
jgi:two-component system LytT family response regulator